MRSQRTCWSIYTNFGFCLSTFRFGSRCLISVRKGAFLRNLLGWRLQWLLQLQLRWLWLWWYMGLLIRYAIYVGRWRVIRRITIPLIVGRMLGRIVRRPAGCKANRNSFSKSTRPMERLSSNKPSFGTGDNHLEGHWRSIVLDTLGCSCLSYFKLVETCRCKRKSTNYAAGNRLTRLQKYD